MNWFINLFKQRPRAAQPDSEGIDRLKQLLKQMQNLKEPKINGTPTKEYYSHLGCEAVAQMLVIAADEPLTVTDTQRSHMLSGIAEYTDANYGKELTFEHPWSERAKILTEMYQIAFPK